MVSTRTRSGPIALLLAVAARLLVIGSLAVQPAYAETISVNVEEGLVSIRAVAAPADDVLRALADATGLRLVMQGSLRKTVNMDAEQISLSDAVSGILDSADSFQLFMPATDDDAPGGRANALLWIFAEGSGTPYMIDYLETTLLRGSVAEKKAAIQSLQSLGSTAAANALTLALADDDKRVQQAAMQALSKIGGPEALAALGSAMAADDPVVRAKVAAALGSAEDASSTGYLDIALNDEDPRVRAAATEALGDLGTDAARARLRTALGDKDPEIRERALDILENLDDEALFHAVFPAQ